MMQICCGSCLHPYAVQVMTGENKGSEQDRAAVAAAAKYEKWKENGVLLRAFFYIAGTHLFAGFVWLLFVLGEHAEK